MAAFWHQKIKWQYTGVSHYRHWLLLQHQEATTSKPQANIDLDNNLTDDQLQLEDPQDFLEEEDTLLPNSDASQDEYYSTAIDAIPDCLMI